MRKLISGYIVPIVILALIAFGALHFWRMQQGVEHTDDASIEGSIIPIAPKVSGYITELYVTDNQSIKKGDQIAQIDQRDYEIALEQAKADLAVAEARLSGGQHNLASTTVSAPSNLTSAESQVAAATAEWKNAQKALKRLQEISDAARSKQSLDNAIADEKSARSNLEDAKARLKAAQTAPDTIGASQASVKEQQAAVLRAQANVSLAQKNLDDTTILAPSDGLVTRRSVEAGAYVQPGLQLMTIVSHDLWVVANFKETQLRDMKPGQRVDIEIDAYPGKIFKGKIDSIQSGTGARFSLFPPENATGNFVKIVQRVPVKILFDEQPSENFHLGPGMSVVPTVHVQ